MLQTLAERYPTDTPESRFEIQEATRDLGQQPRKELGPEKRIRLRDAVELRFIYGIPVASISGVKLLDWIEERRKARRTAVLTELVKASAYADVPRTAIEKLHRNSRRNNS